MIDPLNEKPGYVYGIQSLGLIKIGVSQNIQSRMNKMRLDNPHELTLVFRRQSTAPYTLERQMHLLLADKAVGREWFRVTIEEVRAAAYTARLETRRIETVYRQKFAVAVAKRERLTRLDAHSGHVSSNNNGL